MAQWINDVITRAQCCMDACPQLRAPSQTVPPEPTPPSTPCPHRAPATGQLQEGAHCDKVHPAALVPPTHNVADSTKALDTTPPETNKHDSKPGPQDAGLNEIEEQTQGKDQCLRGTPRAKREVRTRLRFWSEQKKHHTPATAPEESGSPPRRRGSSPTPQYIVEVHLPPCGIVLQTTETSSQPTVTAGEHERSRGDASSRKRQGATGSAKEGQPGEAPTRKVAQKAAKAASQQQATREGPHSNSGCGQAGSPACQSPQLLHPHHGVRVDGRKCFKNFLFSFGFIHVSHFDGSCDLYSLRDSQSFCPLQRVAQLIFRNTNVSHHRRIFLDMLNYYVPDALNRLTPDDARPPATGIIHILAETKDALDLMRAFKAAGGDLTSKCGRGALTPGMYSFFCVTNMACMFLTFCIPSHYTHCYTMLLGDYSNLKDMTFRSRSTALRGTYTHSPNWSSLPREEAFIIATQLAHSVFLQTHTHAQPMTSCLRQMSLGVAIVSGTPHASLSAG